MRSDPRRRARSRVGAEKGAARKVDLTFPEGIATRALGTKEVFWSDDVARLPGANLEAIATFEIKQLLAAPMLGSNGELTGMFCVLDRLDKAGISPEDIRRTCR